MLRIFFYLSLCSPSAVMADAVDLWIAYPEPDRIVVCGVSESGFEETYSIQSELISCPPALSLGSGGLPAVAWLDAERAVLFSGFDGSVWSAPEEVCPPPRGFRGLPSLGITGNGNTVVAWAEALPGKTEDIFFRARNDGVWGSIRRAHEENRTPDILPKVITGPGGSYNIIWKSLEGGRYTSRSLPLKAIHKGGDEIPEEVSAALLKFGLPPETAISWRYPSGTAVSCYLRELEDGDTALRRSRKNTQYERLSDSIRIVAFGDSITYGRGSSSNGPASGYPVYLKAILEYDFPEQAFEVINEGNPGEKTDDGLNRIDSVLDEYQPDFILIMEGTNDIYYGISYETIQENLKQMAFRAASRGVTPVLATIIPADPDIRPQQYSSTRSFYLGRYVQILKDRYGIPYSDQWEEFHSVPDFGSTLIYPYPGNHPNDNGYRYVMAPEWAETVIPLLGIDFDPYGPVVALTEDTPVVRRGAAVSFDYSLVASNDMVRNAVDAYAALRTPSGRLYFLNSGWQLTGGRTPIARKILLDTVPSEGRLHSMYIDPRWPTGSYGLYVVTVRSLRDPLNSAYWTINLASISFVVTE